MLSIDQVEARVYLEPNVTQPSDEVFVSQIHVFQYLTGRDRSKFCQESIRDANKPRERVLDVARHLQVEEVQT